jgi:protoporphyrin/coproporphyrin ferrochelatase
MRMNQNQERLAIVLFNLGGPDSLESVRPFLKNLFSDPAIISLSWPVRAVVAEIISRARSSKAQKIYQQIGGRSPLLENTKAQSRGLSYLINNELPNYNIDVFVAMRYWHPQIKEVVGQVKSFRPNRIVLLPLYPQFSSVTTGSSFKEWHKQAQQQKLCVPTIEIQSYHQNPTFIEAHINQLTPWIERASCYGKPRLLFSAHGLPQKVIRAGDPYESHVHQTVNAIMQKLPPNTDGVVCYQSKVGPLKWLEPSTEHEIKRAGEQKVPIIIVPITFVSEHVETLVELDGDYQKLANHCGVPFFGRVPALGDHPAFLQSLLETIKNNINYKDNMND